MWMCREKGKRKKKGREKQQVGRGGALFILAVYVVMERGRSSVLFATERGLIAIPAHAERQPVIRVCLTQPSATPVPASIIPDPEPSRRPTLINAVIIIFSLHPLWSFFFLSQNRSKRGNLAAISQVEASYDPSCDARCVYQKHATRQISCDLRQVCRSASATFHSKQAFLLYFI